MTHKVRVSRCTRLLAACGLAFGLAAAAAPVAMASPVAKVSDVGWLRLAHLSPNAPAVDVYLYSAGDKTADIVLHHVSYGTVSSYQTVQAGDYTVAMRAANAAATSSPVLSTTIDIASGRAYTVAGMGPASGLRLQVMDDALTTPKGMALVRVIQASLKEKQVTVTAGSQKLASNLAFGTFTHYQTVKPGTWTVHASGGGESTTATLNVTADTTHTIVVLDDPGHLSLDDLTDAAGSNLLPQGGAQTGFGGMATHPGSAIAPWAAAMGLGVVVAAAGALWLRRNRRPYVPGSHAR